MTRADGTRRERPYQLHYTSEDARGGTWSVYVEEYADRDAPEPVEGSQRVVAAGLPDEATADARCDELQRDCERAL